MDEHILRGWRGHEVIQFPQPVSFEPVDLAPDDLGVTRTFPLSLYWLMMIPAVPNAMPNGADLAGDRELDVFAGEIVRRQIP